MFFFIVAPAKLLHKYLRRNERILAMKKFLLGVIVGVVLICAWVTLSASYKARKAEQAAREAARAAASQTPVR